jgi:hypothetical protein
MRQHYYHPEMKGSWSIKAVLPTIAPELDYANLLEVSDGAQARSAYLEMIHPDTTAARKKALEEELLTYCGRDSMAMVKIVHFFETDSGYTATKVRLFCRSMHMLVLTIDYKLSSDYFG